MIIRYSVIFISGIVFSVILIGHLKKTILGRKLTSSQGVPFIGGICILAAFILSCLLGFGILGIKSSLPLGIIIPSSLMLLLGLIDDCRELSVVAKLLVQVASTCLLILFGVRTQIVNIGAFFNIAITFIWMIGITNSFNLLDVVDGLSALVSIIISLTFFYVSVWSGNYVLAVLALALVGALIGFLRYNLPPAKVYMGNSGSHFLGFICAAIAIAISYASLGKEIALFSPLLILGFPIFDTFFLVLMRLSKGRMVFKKSKDHLPLRLLSLGYSKKQTLSVISLLCLFFCICGLFLIIVPNLFGVVILILIILVSFMVTKRMSGVAVND